MQETETEDDNKVCVTNCRLLDYKLFAGLKKIRSRYVIGL